MNTASVIEFLLLLLIAASVIAVITSRLRIPYTIALVVAGFGIDFFQLPIRAILGPNATQILTPEVILIVFLPGLLFESGININVRLLRENLAPILVLAVAGVVTATLLTGMAAHWLLGLPLLAAFVFGALISATDPISVLALFKDMRVDKRLAVIVEGESLLNDGTAVVIFQILLVGVTTGQISVSSGVGTFLQVALGGAALGLSMGYAASKITEQVDDARIEITLTTILAYGSYLAAESLHVSGVIATVMAGLMVGNYGAEFGMSARTRVALWSFWEYVAFVINSLVFLLIGMEVHIADLVTSWPAALLAIAVVLLTRTAVVYSLTPISNLFARKVPVSWQHVLVWGGLHGGVSMALALSLPSDFPYRSLVLTVTFGVVAFSIVVQGLTIKPLMGLLGLRQVKADAYDRLKIIGMALSSAQSELEDLRESDLITQSVYSRLRGELAKRGEQQKQELEQMQLNQPGIADEELRMARVRLWTAEKNVIQRAAADGLVSVDAGDAMLEELDQHLDKLRDHE